MNKIKDVADLPRVDSLVESAYNSTKAIQWALENKQEMFKDPRPSYESLSSYFLLSDSDASDCGGTEGSVDLETQIKQEGQLKISERAGSLDEMKMGMLGFKPGFTDNSPEDIVKQVKARIAYFKQSGMEISQKSTKAVYKRIT